MPAPVCCSSFSCHTRTSRDTRWRKGWTHKNKSWLILQRSCPFLPELSLEVCCHVKPSLVLSKCCYWYIHNISVYNLLYVRVDREKSVLRSICIQSNQPMQLFSLVLTAKTGGSSLQEVLDAQLRYRSFSWPFSSLQLSGSATGARC